MTLWLKGAVGIEPPWWATLLEMAADWHTPPWVIEAECSEYWFARWLAYRNAKASANG